MSKFPTGFSEPVTELVSLGDQDIWGEWPDYADLGITSEHILELIRIIEEIELFWPIGDTESPEVSAPIHAWRALGQLQATEAINPLIELVEKNEYLDSDWIGEEIPVVMAMIGPVCVPPLVNYLLTPEKQDWASVTVAHSLEKIGNRNPDSRSLCVSALQSVMENFLQNDPLLNGFLISYLADLDAAEAAPLVERAYQADAVDLSIIGDFEEFQIAVGLLEERITPAPRFQPDFFPPELTTSLEKLFDDPPPEKEEAEDAAWTAGEEKEIEHSRGF